MRATVYAALFGTLISGTPLFAQDKAQQLTKEEALKMARSIEGEELGRKWFDSGDDEGPYFHAGRIYLDRHGNVNYTVADPHGRLGRVGLGMGGSDAVELRMDFFVSAKGFGWVTSNLFDAQVESTRPKPAEDFRPRRHRALGPAAVMAIEEGNLTLLKVLFSNGLKIDEVLDFKHKQTALYQAVWNRKLDIAKFLIGQGADQTIRSRSLDRPIDLAIRREMDDFCKLLAKPDAEEATVDNIPVGVLAEVFAGYHRKEIQFIEWQEGDPSKELLAWLKEIMPKPRAASRMETIKTRPLGAHSWYRDNSDDGFGSLLQVSVKPDGKRWKVRLRDSVGPIMAGGGWEATISKSHGYWCRSVVSSWDE